MSTISILAVVQKADTRARSRLLSPVPIGYPVSEVKYAEKRLPPTGSSFSGEVASILIIYAQSSVTVSLTVNGNTITQTITGLLVFPMACSYTITHPAPSSGQGTPPDALVTVVSD